MLCRNSKRRCRFFSFHSRADSFDLISRFSFLTPAAAPIARPSTGARWAPNRPFFYSLNCCIMFCIEILSMNIFEIVGQEKFEFGGDDRT